MILIFMEGLPEQYTVRTYCTIYVFVDLIKTQMLVFKKNPPHMVTEI